MLYSTPNAWNNIITYFAKQQPTDNPLVRGGSNSVVVASPRQIYQGGNDVYHLVSYSACLLSNVESEKKPVGGSEQKTAAATSGTGVFLPAYRTRISRAHGGDDVKSNGDMDQEEHKTENYEEEVPIEMLLPSEWTY